MDTLSFNDSTWLHFLEFQLDYCIYTKVMEQKYCLKSKNLTIFALYLQVLNWSAASENTSMEVIQRWFTGIKP